MAARPGSLALVPSALALLLGLVPDASAQTLAPRAPLDAGPVSVPVFEGDEAQAPIGGLRLTVKLADGVRGRAVDGALTSLVGADLSPVADLAASEGLTFRPLIDIGEQRVDALLARAQANTGRAQPDLMGMLAVTVPSSEPAELVRVGEALRALPQVEYVHIEALGCPPPGDISPTTPDLSGNQGYVDPDPGINATAAWGQGVTGAGVRVSDCEYGWDYIHEEFNDVDLNPEPGQTIAAGVYSNGWDDHGTAVLGEMVAPDNGYGVTGSCPDVETATYPEWTNQGGFRRVACITSAIADSDPGDLVLLEMQTVNFGSNYGPAELDPNVFNVVSAGSAAGVVVVGAAGNGDQNLDSGTYSTYLGWGDSGSIIVGAGSSNSGHNKLSFSTYGARVDLQGWGENVFSTGYGWFAEYGGDEHQSYTSSFSGTSSASPIVTGAAALVQARSIELNGQGLPPSNLRQLLIDTGNDQGSGGHIGPLPDVGAAMANIGGFDPDPWVDLGLGLSGVSGVPVQTATGILVAGSAFNIQVDDVAPLQWSWWILGASDISAPFKGGTLVPSPDILAGPFITAFGGFVIVNGTFPPGIPAGTKIYSQWWTPDAQAIKGFSASNAMEGTAQ
jgi:subtilisin family serine protease